MFFSLLYIPVVVGVYTYAGIKNAALVLSFLASVFIVKLFIQKSARETFISPLIALLLGSIGYVLGDFMALKLYPFVLSLLFFIFFTYSVLSKRFLLITWIEKFKKRPLSELERNDIQISHWLWVVVLGFNSAVHAWLVWEANIQVWAIYSFVGWYFLFGLTIVLQIVYVHRRDLRQWTRNIWGYGLFAGVIVLGFIPAMVGYLYQRLTNHPKPHIFFQRVTAAMFRIFFTYAPNTASIQLIKSDEIDENGSYIYVASHESWLDYPLMGAYITDLYHLTNKKKAFVWILRPIAVLLGVIDGVGGNPLHVLLQKLRQRSNVLVFPEGTRSADGIIGPFKKGAFSLSIESGCAVIPVVISGTRFLVQKGSMHWRPEKQIVISLTMLSPIHPMENESVEVFSERVRLLMLQYQKNHNG